MGEFPKVAPEPADDDIVQILLPEFAAREIERRLGLTFAPPLLFSEEDLPTYTIQVPRC